jgi:hypothetical protein
MNAQEFRPVFGSIDAGAVAQRLGECKCLFVKIQNRFTNADGTPNGKSIFYGDSTQQTFEIVSGQFSDWIPVTDVNDLYVRTDSGDCTVAWQASMRAG